MTTRIAQGVVKFAVDPSEDDRIAQGMTKFVIVGDDSIRIAQGVAKFVVRTVPIARIAKFYPPMNTTQAQAPYVRVNNGAS